MNSAGRNTRTSSIVRPFTADPIARTGIQWNEAFHLLAAVEAFFVLSEDFVANILDVCAHVQTAQFLASADFLLELQGKRQTASLESIARQGEETLPSKPCAVQHDDGCVRRCQKERSSSLSRESRRFNKDSLV